MTAPPVFSVSAELASDTVATAPGTIAIVNWSVDLESVVEAQVEFGLDDSYGMAAPVDVSLPDHRTVLLGMKPERTYHFRIVASDGVSTHVSDDYTLTTGPKTDLVPITRFTVLDEAARARGFMIGSFYQGEGSATPFIVDADGDVVWWYEGGPRGIARARLSADAKNVWIVEVDNVGGPLVRVSTDTLDVEVYPSTVASHDITAVTGDVMAYIDYGEDDCDSIFEIDPSGTTREVFESAGLVSPTEGLVGCHGNAVRYSRSHDLYTYSDYQQELFAIDRTGQVKWRLTDLVSGGKDAWGGEQHGHHLLDDRLLVFANRGASPWESQVIAFDLDGNELRRFTSRSFSQNMGGVQRLPGGNTLINYSYASFVTEVDPDDNVVLEMEGGGRFGYLEWRDTLYGPPAEP
jgi:hypothetical protein